VDQMDVKFLEIQKIIKHYDIFLKFKIFF